MLRECYFPSEEINREENKGEGEGIEGEIQ